LEDLIWMTYRRRRSFRLEGYDYSTAGAYFVTVCADGRACLFGNIVDGAVRLNPCGMAVLEAWDALPAHYPHVLLDAFIVMPNHMHGIILFDDRADVLVGADVTTRTSDAKSVGAGFKPAPTSGGIVGSGAGLKPAPTRRALPEIVRAFKTFSAKRINGLRATPGAPVWQRNYYEHVVRDERALNRIRQYIAENPARWADDQDNPENWSRQGGFETRPYIPRDVR
jgi:REP element-mobilizing transposase RayT